MDTRVRFARVAYLHAAAIKWHFDAGESAINMLPRGKRSRCSTRFIIGIGVFARSARKVNLTACLISHSRARHRIAQVIPGALCDLVKRRTFKSEKRLGR